MALVQTYPVSVPAWWLHPTAIWWAYPYWNHITLFNCGDMHPFQVAETFP